MDQESLLGGTGNTKPGDKGYNSLPNPKLRRGDDNRRSYSVVNPNPGFAPKFSDVVGDESIVSGKSTVPNSKQNSYGKTPPPPGDPPLSPRNFVKTMGVTVDFPERPTIQAEGPTPENDLEAILIPEAGEENEKENENKPKNKNTLRLVIAVRGIIFSSYFILSMILLAWVFDDSRSCFIRQSYSQRALGSFSSDNMFTSTQVVRPPPRSRSEVKAGFAVWVSPCIVFKIIYIPLSF